MTTSHIQCGRFLQEQGHKIRKNIFHQDNESAIKLVSNGFRSRGEKSKHISIRYFFIKDIMQREEIKLKHCKTNKMIGDYFTKPVQGLFKKLRDHIMGITIFPIEERVENYDKKDENGKRLKI